MSIRQLGVLVCLTLLGGVSGHVAHATSTAERHFLYVAEPGIRNYVEYGGIGVLVFDMDAGYRFVRRIPTFDVAPGKEPENVKGIAAHAGSGRLYVSTIKRIAAFDLSTDKLIWNREYEGGCDRLAISPDGKLLYVPSFEGPHWLAVDAQTGNVVAKIVTNSGAHNTIYGPDGHRVYLAGLHSPLLSIADPATHRVVATVGPFGNSIRPFTINAGADALLRERQRAAWVRGRRHPHWEDAASRRGDGLHQGTREAAWLPEPRHRPDARREGAVAG